MHGKFHRKALFDADLRKGIIEKPINLNLSGQNTHQGAAQEPSLTHHMKAVARGIGQANPHGCLFATRSNGGGMRACRGGAC